MTLHSKEHIAIMDQFERDWKRFPVRGRLDRESPDQWARGNIYQDMQVNQYFLMYRYGVSFGKCLERFS